MPKKIIYIATKTIQKTFNYFSIDLLLKTLFLPWKRDEIDMTNMALDDRLKVLGMNLVSRMVGAIVRSGAIIIGLILVVFEFVAEIFLIILFIALPILALYLIFKSVL